MSASAGSGRSTGGGRASTFLAPRLGAVGLLTATGAVATVTTIAGFAGRFSWALDLASHFRVQYLVVLAVVAAVLFAVRARRVAMLFAAFAAVNLVLVLPMYFGDRPPTGARGEPLRAILTNVYTANTDHAAVIETIDAQDPDFVMLQEVNSRWMLALSALGSKYPHVVEHPREDNFGIALLSKHRIVYARTLDIASVGVPSILALVEVVGRRFFILGTHTLPPASSEYSRLRNLQLAALPGVVAALDAPLLLLGDLNVSPWSSHFRRLLRDSGLRDASEGRGVQPTWPTHMFPLRIPIDHCLYSTGIEILDKAIGSHVGSDHFPVVIEFALS